MNTAATVTRTPGFDRRIEIWFTPTRRGLRAYYYSYPQFRAMPLPLAKAEAFIAMDQADVIAALPWKA